MQQYKKILGKVMMTAEGTYDSNKEYDPISLITDEETGKSYISRKEVPAGTQINNREYWQPVASSGIIDNGVIILNRKNSDGQVPIYDLKSAAEAVAVGDRKGGVILGFLGFNAETDTVPTWKLYQYNDVSPSNWINIDYWLPLDYTNKYAGWFDNEEALYDNVPFPKIGMYAYVGNSASSAVIYRCYNDRVWHPTEDKAFSGVVNLADEEDITSKQNKLKFKDKEYNPAQYNGLGRIYLRKNIVDRKNILTQTMMQATNTIYIIQYDYDLQGETITIPEGCTLDFQGGSFSNGTIVGNGTNIKANTSKIFDVNLNIIGKWENSKGFPEWFGAKGDGETDDREFIQKCLDTFIETYLLDKVYLLSSCSEDNFVLIMKEGTKLIGVEKGRNNYFIESSLKSDSVDIIGEDVILLGVNRHCEVRDITLEGTKLPMDFEKTNKCCGISGVYADNYKVILTNVQTKYLYYGFNISCWMSTFKRCAAKGCKYGFVFHGFAKDVTNGYMDIEEDMTANVEITSLVIQQCYCNDCFIRGFILYKVIYSTMISCAADGTGTFKRANWTGYPPEMENITDDNTNAPYTFWKCRGVTATGCGSEGCHKLIESKHNLSLEISNMMVYMATHGLDTFNYTKWIYSEDDINVSIKKICFYCYPWKISNSFIYVKGCTEPTLVNKVIPSYITFEDILSMDYGIPLVRTFITVSDLVEGSSVVLKSFKDEESIDITKEKNPGLGALIYNAYDCSGSLKKYYSINSARREVKFYVPDGGQSGAALRPTTVKGNGGKLVFYSDDNSTSNANLHVLNSEIGCTFENFESILFDKIRLYPYNRNELQYILKFKDCGNVVFKDCRILQLNNFENVIKQFEIEGNTILSFYNVTLRDGTFYNILYYKDGEFINPDGTNINLVKII